MFKILFSLTAVLLISSCARTSTMPLSKDTVRVSVRAAPICGARGAQKVALQTAAIQTLRAGFDSFIIYNGQYQSTPTVAGYTPVQAHTTRMGNITQTRVTGGTPIVLNKHHQGITVKMFKAGQRGSDNALSARQILGKDWKSMTEKDINTCR